MVSRLVGGAVGMLVAVAMVACSDADSGVDSADGDETATSLATGTSNQSSAESVASAAVAPVTSAETPATTPPLVRTVLLGTITGGNSGGVGSDSTDSASELVRNDDGSCSGWDARTGNLWTSDVQGGAPITVVDAETGEILATGTLANGVAADVSGPLVDDIGEQWQCSFSFEIPDVPQVAAYKVQVGGQNPWTLVPDPSRPNAFVTSIGTPAESSAVSDCSADAGLPEEVFEWGAVGQYWNNGVSAVCSAGLRVPDGGIKRPCRPANIGSDRVVSVVSAADPSIVYEDIDGLKVDVTTLTPGTEVIVNVATGVPCG
jgi:hypothetical protein